MKLKLDNDSINESFFENTRLLGITAPIKNYLFAWNLNSNLGFNFRLNNDIEIPLIRKERTYRFSIYQSNESNSALIHLLYHNHCDGEYLLPEFKHMDYLWLMKDDMVDDEKCNWIRQSIKTINGVQLVAELTNEQIRNKGNMII